MINLTVNKVFIELCKSILILFINKFYGSLLIILLILDLQLTIQSWLVPTQQDGCSTHGDIQRHSKNLRSSEVKPGALVKLFPKE